MIKFLKKNWAEVIKIVLLFGILWILLLIKDVLHTIDFDVLRVYYLMLS